MQNEREMFVPLMEIGQIVPGSVRLDNNPLSTLPGRALSYDTLPPLLQQLADACSVAGEALAALEEHLHPFVDPCADIFEEGRAEDHSRLSPMHQAILHQVACLQWMTARMEYLKANIRIWGV